MFRKSMNISQQEDALDRIAKYKKTNILKGGYQPEFINCYWKRNKNTVSQKVKHSLKSPFALTIQ